MFPGLLGQKNLKGDIEKCLGISPSSLSAASAKYQFTEHILNYI
jgi:hypothetical protein